MIEHSLWLSLKVPERRINVFKDLGDKRPGILARTFMTLWKLNYLRGQSFNVVKFLLFTALKSRVKVTDQCSNQWLNLRGQLRRSG